jgi:hypothetical protein
VLNPSHANPPIPLGALPQQPSLTGLYFQNLKKSEAQRGVKQVMFADGVADLRSILLVRRAIHPVMDHRHDVKEQPEEENWANTWAEGDTTPEDYADAGGEEALNQSTDKQGLRMRRSFELLFKNGHVVRFEVRHFVSSVTMN